MGEMPIEYSRFASFRMVVLLAGFACIAPAPAAAQATASDPIVVTGKRMTEEEIRRQATEFVRGMGVASGNTAAARWSGPVCLRVVGLAAAQARQVEAKMEEIALDVKIPIDRAKCTPNLLVTFTADPKATVAKAIRRSPRRFSKLQIDHRLALANGPAPVRWWYSTTTLGRDGLNGSMTPSGVLATSDQSQGGMIPYGSGETFQHYDSSMVSTQVNRVLRTASVVIDGKQVRAGQLDAVAAYAAFVGFAEIREWDFAPSGSILSLFNKEGAPRELTEQDFSFLRSLYRLPLDRPARYQRGFLVRDLVAARKSDD